MINDPKKNGFLQLVVHRLFDQTPMKPEKEPNQRYFWEQEGVTVEVYYLHIAQGLISPIFLLHRLM